MRRVRMAAGSPQEEISRAARQRGLAWSQSRIAALERGEKAIKVEELALLPEILSEVFRRPVGLGDLVSPDARIALTPQVTIGGRELVQVLGGRAAMVPATFREIPDPTSLPVGTELSPGLVVLSTPDPRVEVGPFRPIRGELEGWLREAGDAETHAARRLGRSVAEVVIASRPLWGRGFTAHRDMEAASIYGPDASSDRRRAVRGQVSRRMHDELRDYLERCDEAHSEGRPLPSGRSIHTDEMKRAMQASRHRTEDPEQQ
ncbi:hypothetical protein [Frankia sp. CcI49]|uniref:hypothetical protein n=1 Tax=Frankia sp. CcI49 TaxID=1745382 RepID=UPI0013047848|nr:hypothetical protein [Frankia sp. CcI49]